MRLRIAKVTPILPTAVMADSISHYTALGFTVDDYDPTYAFVLHDGTELLHLSLIPRFEPEVNATVVYLHVRDADAWHERWVDLEGVGDVEDREWDMREFSVVDPSRNVLRIGHNI